MDRVRTRDELYFPRKDKVVWKWSQGAATAVGEFASPTSSANYTL
jgi:hypothetical protein